jgi:hypothetical protein
MLMRLLTTILTLLFFVVSASAQKNYRYQDKNFVYNVAIDSALSADSVNYECAVKSISITRKSDNKLAQTILPPENSCFCNMPQDQIFIVEDVNFDNINDIRLLQYLPAAPNLPYYYWTYNPATKVFRRQKALEEITSPEFDHNNRIITSFWRKSCCDHGLSIYKYINGKPILIKESEAAQDLNGESKYISTVRKRINGKMKLVKKTIDIDKGDDNN